VAGVVFFVMETLSGGSHALSYSVLFITKPNAPDPIRTPKLSGLRQGEY
jgi:hypothetical protein